MEYAQVQQLTKKGPFADMAHVLNALGGHGDYSFTIGTYSKDGKSYSRYLVVNKEGKFFDYRHVLAKGEKGAKGGVKDWESETEWKSALGDGSNWLSKENWSRIFGKGFVAPVAQDFRSSVPSLKTQPHSFTKHAAKQKSGIKTRPAALENKPQQRHEQRQTQQSAQNIPKGRSKQADYYEKNKSAKIKKVVQVGKYAFDENERVSALPAQGRIKKILGESGFPSMQNSGANPKIQAKTLEAAEQQASAFDSNLVSLPLGKNASGTSKGDYSTYVSSAGGQRGYDSKGNLLYDSNQGGVIRQAAYTENDIDPVLAKIRLFRPKATAQSVANMLGRMQEVSPLVNKYAKMYGLDPALLYAAIYCESSAVHNTKNGILTSSAGALGLMQVMPGTFEFLQAKNPSLDNIRDLEQNLHAGAMYLRMMLNRYSGKTRNVDGQISFNWGFTAAVMAYNGGPGTVDDFINHGASLPKETREYLQRVTAAYSLFATMKIERIEHMDLKIFVDEARDSVKAFSSGWHFG